MKTIDLGWAMAKEERLGAYFVCPADTGEGYSVPAQSLWVPKCKFKELAAWLTEIAEAKP
jgi:hypothetical protein